MKKSVFLILCLFILSGCIKQNKDIYLEPDAGIDPITEIEDELIKFPMDTSAKIINTYFDLPEFEHYQVNDQFVSLSYEEYPAVVVKRDVCTGDFSEVFGIGKQWGKCSVVDHLKLTVHDYLNYYPNDNEEVGNRQWIEDHNEYLPTPVSEITALLQNSTKVISIPLEFKLNIHNDDLLMNSSSVLFYQPLDETTTRVYSFNKCNQFGFYLKIVDEQYDENNILTETIQSFTFFVCDEYFDERYVYPTVGF